VNAHALGSPGTTGHRPSHAPPGEYARFLARAYADDDRPRRLRHAQERFVRYYPDLAAWQQRPLRERLGWRRYEQQSRRSGPGEDFDPTLGWVNFAARPYLVWLSLTGRLRLDWGWLLGIGVLKPWAIADQLGLPLSAQADELFARLAKLGLASGKRYHRVRWGVPRLVLHRADPDLAAVTIADVEALRDAIRNIGLIPSIDEVLDAHQLATAGPVWGTFAFQTGVALFHGGITDRLPARQKTRPRRPMSTLPRVTAVMDRYVAERALVDRPDSVTATRGALRRLSTWLVTQRPGVDSLAGLRRPDLVEFAGWLETQTKEHTNQPLSQGYRRTIIWNVMAFFRHVCEASWDDVPPRPPLVRSDVPRSTLRVPRYIPAEQLAPLMAAIRALDCLLQRTALLIARWSGARRGEIRRLHLDCLDAYPDGTPRLRLAAGKSLAERAVPVHQEAADAIRALQAMRRAQPDRGLHDPDLGRPVRYLFLRNGRLASPDYLFAAPLRAACVAAGLVNADGEPLVTAHRFRHTLGTQLAEKGARTRTIMAILGHHSAGMSMTYAAISDEEVLRDYQSVLGPGAVLAGPQAAAIRDGQLSQEALEWLRTNFYKTELELGRCLRLPAEGPCECDLYLSCTKFVTTPDYAPRLRERLRVEQQLITDAQQRGWGREVERHQRVAERIRCLLAELGEPVEEP
jgi:integrase